jgi:hypothetical protein
MILDFRSRPEAHGARTDPNPRAAPSDAEIIIFPGVRRERHESPAKPQKRRRAPKRDRLELPD